MIEMLVGLNVSNDREYTEYRKGMTPLLKDAGGDFGYDFKIAETLKSESEEDINRVFTIRFPDENTMNEFFNNSLYKEIKTNHFEKSVKTTTIMAKYNKA